MYGYQLRLTCAVKDFVVGTLNCKGNLMTGPATDLNKICRE